MVKRANSFKEALSVFLFFLCLFGLTYKGLTIEDGALHYETARNFIEKGSFSLPADRFTGLKNTVFWKGGLNGITYLALPPALTICSTPGCALGLMIEKSLFSRARATAVFDLSIKRDEWDNHFRKARYRPSVFFTFLINPVVSSLTLAVLYLILRSLGTKGRNSLILVVATGMTTNIWYFATCDWTQPLAMFTLLSCCFFLLEAMEKDREFSAFYAGLCGGFALLARFDSFLTLSWLVLFLLWKSEKRYKRLSYFSVGFILCLTLLCLWNHWRFGNPLDTGSKHQSFKHLLSRKMNVQFPAALLANLVLPKQGLFFYAPILFCVLLTLRAFAKERPSLTLAILGLCVTNVAFFSAFLLWQTPESIGPRFLVPLIPFITIVLSKLDFALKRDKALFLFLAAIGLCMQICAVSHPLRLSTRESLPLFSISKPSYASLLSSPLWLHGKEMVSGDIELWWLMNWRLTVVGLVLFIIGGRQFVRLFSCYQSCV